MKWAYSVEAVRAAEQQVMRDVPAGALMNRAAHALAVVVSDFVGFRYGAQAVLLVGAGDNGGDALFAGAELARRGFGVRAMLTDPSRAHAEGVAALLAAGGRLVPGGPIGDCDVIIDGLVGIGASGPLRGRALDFARHAGAAAAPVIAVDLPSGVDPSTGAVSGEAISAALTVCFGALKPGLLVGAGRLRAGRVQLVDIGIGSALVGDPVLWQLEDADVAAALRAPQPDDDKYTRGVVGVVAGSPQYPGAAQLAVGSALLGGVGAVRYAGPAAVEVSRRWPEVLVSTSVNGAGRVQCWAVGPGLGSGFEAEQSLAAALALPVPVLVDADGLTLLAQRRELLARRKAATVLTPHDREFARLFGEVGADRVGAARRAADSCGAVVLLKGFATIVAEPGGRCWVNSTGSPVLATAGSGDVLSGLIGSLIGSGLDPAFGAAVGAHLHGLAGTVAARRGPVTAPALLSALSDVIGDFS
ncbi:MAG: carbohydrate kinase, YjeF related protein [Frankiales bacterium]|nr:carbohydrate kinase, YjeF related protein [Frankiales bacterium]